MSTITKSQLARLAFARIRQIAPNELFLADDKDTCELEISLCKARLETSIFGGVTLWTNDTAIPTNIVEGFLLCLLPSLANHYTSVVIPNDYWDNGFQQLCGQLARGYNSYTFNSDTIEDVTLLLLNRRTSIGSGDIQQNISVPITFQSWITGLKNVSASATVKIWGSNDPSCLDSQQNAAKVAIFETDLSGVGLGEDVAVQSKDFVCNTQYAYYWAEATSFGGVDTTLTVSAIAKTSDVNFIGTVVYESGGNDMSISFPQFIYVGEGGSYSNLAEALDAINDASISKPYTIKMLPGVYSIEESLSIPSFVAVEGSGQSSTFLEFNSVSYISINKNSRVANLTIIGDRENGGNEGFLHAGGYGPIHRLTDFFLEDVSFYHTGGYGTALTFTTQDHVAFLRNINIFTTSIGIEARGYLYLKSCNIFLSGNATGTNYIGIIVKNMCRLYIWDMKLGTGYGETSIPGFGNNLEIDNDPNANVIGVWIPPNNPTNVRVEIHDLESFIRNDSATTGYFNSVRAEGVSTVRMFGCFTKTETPLNGALQFDLFCSPTATFEIYSCRYMGSKGNITSRDQRALSSKTFANNNEVLTTESPGGDGGTVLCDATDGSFTLYLDQDWLGGIPGGLQWTFIKTDSTANTVTIAGEGATKISGQSSKVLSNQYDHVTMVHDEIHSFKWYITA